MHIKTWMTDDQLKLNDDKTEALLFPFSCSLKPSTVPLPDSITLGSHNIPFSDSARNLAFILDSKLSMKKHVIKICQIAYFELKRISSIRRFLTEDAAKTLFTSYILSRLDYCSCLLVGIHLILSSSLSRKIKTLLQDSFSWHPGTTTQHLSWKKNLHWLPSSERIKSLVCVSVLYMVLVLLTSLNCYLSTLHLVHCALLLTPAC